MKRRSIDRKSRPQQPSRQLPKRAARIVGFQPGSRWRLDGAVVTVLAVLSVDRLLVRQASDSRTETVTASRLVPIEGAEGAGHRHRSAADFEPRVWSRALEEQTQLAALSTHQTKATMARAARALKLSERQLRRKLRRYTELNTLDAFLPLRPGPVPGSRQLHPELERLIHEEIAQGLSVSADIGVDDVLPILVEAAKALDLRPPSRATVSRRLNQARRRTDLLPAAVGQEIAYRNKPVRGAHGADGPLSIVEMDHTVCDVHLIEPVTGYPIGRPLLTLMIDRATRVVLGMLLTLEAPSRLSVGLCLHHGVFPKQAWLTGLGLTDGCWPGFGLIGTMYTDNGSEFHAQSLRRSAQVYGIQLAYRPPKDPAAGGIIERALGTFLRKIRLLPGTSYSRWLGKTPRNAERAARFTLKELEVYLARQISIYHKTPHRTLGMPPATAWERAWVVNGVVIFSR
ncbi:MAG: hypothetical protein WCO67_00265 [Betaproteobacteria bacterium]